MGNCLPTAAACLFAACLASAAAPAGSEKYAGTWEAKSKDTVFLVLKIATGEKISGTMRAGRVHMDDKGELLEVTPPEDQENPIFFAHLEDGKLVFNCQDNDDAVIQFELKLTGENTAELRIVDKDHPDLKGFAIHRGHS